MLAYLIIFAASIFGYAGLSVWVMPAGAIALATLTYVEHRALYDRAGEVGQSLVDETLVGSLVTSLCAMLMSFGFGAAFRLLA